MRTDITCALGGTNLHAVDSRIYVEEITEKPAMDFQTANRANYGILPLRDPQRQSLAITVKLLIKEKNRIDRMAVVQKVYGWIKSGWFTTNMREGLRIYVFCNEEPQVTVYDWSTRMEIKFIAYGEAYWQEVTPVSVSSSSAVSSATVTIKPNGTRNCFLEADIAPSSGTLTSVTIKKGSQQFVLSGLSVTASAPLQIYYDELHILHIVSGSTSLMSKRSAASADDIILTAGSNNSITLTFSTACTYTIRARGLYK